MLCNARVLSSLLQLSLLILEVCSSAQQSLQAWLQSQQPLPKQAAAVSYPSAVHTDISDPAVVSDTDGAAVIDLTLDSDSEGHDDATALPDQASGHAGHDMQLPNQAIKTERLKQAGLLLSQEGPCTREGSQLPDQAQASGLLLHQAFAVGEEVEDLCMLCAYGMDLAAALGCLLEQMEKWPGISFELVCDCPRDGPAPLAKPGLFQA